VFQHDVTLLPTSRDQIARCCGAFDRAPTDAGPLLKRAAVAITLVDDGALAFLLTRRAANLRGHGGQYALPGGRCDPGETATEAALRELHEELGIPLDAESVLGVLDDYPTRSGYLITPIVVWAGSGASILPNPAEVAAVHHIPLDAIMAEDAFDFVRIPESERRVVRFRHREEGHIHAPTAALIYQFREVLAGRSTRVADLEQPVFAWR
jgi:8-oxo-dGTP pyrophosphatase MutT (NUDIX family)